jgi:hypothetical protein
MTPEDIAFQQRCLEVIARGEPITPDAARFAAEVFKEIVERVEDRLLPEHSIGLDPAERADLEQLQAATAEAYDVFWAQANGFAIGKD